MSLAHRAYWHWLTADGGHRLYYCYKIYQIVVHKYIFLFYSTVHFSGGGDIPPNDDLCKEANGECLYTYRGGCDDPGAFTRGLCAGPDYRQCCIKPDETANIGKSILHLIWEWVNGRVYQSVCFTSRCSDNPVTYGVLQRFSGIFKSIVNKNKRAQVNPKSKLNNGSFITDKAIISS